MRLRILSDLHLEARPWDWAPQGEDAVILAGDIADRSPSGRVNAARFWDALGASHTPVIYVLGNHEGHGDWLPRDRLLQAIRAEVPNNVRLLEEEAITLGSLRILGCPLWTDFSLPSTEAPTNEVTTREDAMRLADSGIADFTYLCLPDTAKPERITAVDMARWHRQDAAWLATTIPTTQLQTLVVTHFPPSVKSLAAVASDSPLRPYFATECPHLLQPPVTTWIHGHIHQSCRYHHHGVEVICNPRGNLVRGGNPAFDPALVVTIPD